MEQIDYFKVISLLQTYKGRNLQINVVGAISIPFLIKDFDYEDYKEEICFGEKDEDMGSWFFIDKAEMNAWNHYDTFNTADSLIFKLVLDEPEDFAEEDLLITYIVIMCPLEGVEMNGGGHNE